MCVYTVGYYSAIENETLPFAATYEDLGMVTQSEMSQKRRDKYHVLSLTCAI